MQWLKDLCDIIRDNWFILFVSLLVVGNFIECIIKTYFDAKYKRRDR